MRLTWLRFILLFSLIAFLQRPVFAQQTDSTLQMLPPSPVPDSVFGTVDYYHWRETDFRQRAAVAKLDVESPAYYCAYGHKYAHRFSWQIRPKLSDEGKQWLDLTLLLLQVGTEACLHDQPELELYPEAFNRALFDLHPEVYAKAGFYELSFADQLRIIIRLDPYDLISREGRRQARVMVQGYLKHKARQLAGTKR